MADDPDQAGQVTTIRAITRVTAPPLVPEVVLHLAEEPFAAWEVTARLGPPSPPYWAFAWAGGQALGRYVLDHPQTVAGRRVLDLASGSGLVAICAARAGAREVTACDVDPLAQTAIGLNAALNEVRVDVLRDDVLARALDWPEVVLAGDVCYDPDLSAEMTRFLRRQYRRGADVLIGDPHRPYLPADLAVLARYEVPDTAHLEERAVTAASVLALD
jgi:predicted nicotinamide N-methyase